MESDILDDVTGWNSRPFTDGYDGLRDLAGREFNGAVTDGVAWLFFLNGNVVGVFDGTIEDFDGADGTAYEAPHPSLPLLYAMQQSGGETRAKYYTNETPISEVDRTLSAGNFTGYVELSENVLSGDYYTVYHGGRSMSAAYVGSSRRLVTGDEAFDLADDEVGIYEVKTVPVEITEIPGDVDDEDDEAVGGVGTTSDAVDTDESDHEDDVAAEGADTSETGAETNADPVVDSEDTDGVADEPETAIDAASADESETTFGAESTDESEAAPDAESTDRTDTGEDTEPPATEMAAGDSTARDPSATDDTAAPVADEAATDPTQEVTFGDDSELDDDAVSDLADEVIPDTTFEDEPAEGGDEGASVYSAESEWQETKTIPALDPDQSMKSAASGENTASGGRQGSTTGASDRSGAGRSSSSATDSSAANTRRTSQSSRPRSGNAAGAGVSTKQVTKLKEKLSESEEARQAAEAARERLASKLESAEAERDDLQSERDDLRARAKELDSRVDDLEAQVDRLESELAEARASQPDPERAITPREALDGTNLFVRYDSKSAGTLEKAHDGRVDREEVNTNLRLEHHTGFDADEAHVDGQPFEAFLHESIEYGFAKWAVEDLLYEIRDTGHEAALQDLYDAIPKIDRAELNGTVSIEYTENGEEHREQQQFDVVLRDRMGNPLLVANLNDSREAASEEMMRELIENSRRLAETSDSLGAGFLVTASFFAPEALETASEATSGGLLSRSKRESFVKLSRKQGFHLCLVETRNGDFHLNVPEL